MAIMAPSGGPLKTTVLQVKSPESGVRALWGQRWARLAFFIHGGHKYCQNGGMALAPTTTAELSGGCRPEGSAIAIMVPRRGPQEAAYLQGKMLGCP